MMDMPTSPGGMPGDTRDPDEKAKDKKRGLDSDMLYAKSRLEEATSINKADIQADPDAMKIVASIQDLLSGLSEAETPAEDAGPGADEGMGDMSMDQARPMLKAAGFGQ